MKPVCAIYSTFLQRAFDQVIHDVALQKLEVFFVLDRAGVVGADGPTHHGAFDLAYLRTVPNMVVMAPKDENELRRMVRTGIEHEGGPIALRFPRGSGRGVPLEETVEPVPVGQGEVLRKGSQVLLVGLGSGVGMAESAAEILGERGIHPTVVNARFAKPLDEELLLELASHHDRVVTIEEGALAGGFGSAVLELFHDSMVHPPQVIRFGLPDRFIDHGKPEDLLHEIGLSGPAIAEELLSAMARDERQIDLGRRRRIAADEN
jgi:1-deoxy-D-xylulose-5-phosphate synthase